MRACWLVPALILAACMGGDDAGDSVNAEAPRPKLTCDGLEDRILDATPSRAGLVHVFGAPDAMAVETEPNRHLPGETDTLLTLRYEGLVFRLRIPPSGNELPEHALISANRFVRYTAVGVGAPTAQVIAIVGEPGVRTDEALVYDCGEGAPAPVTFHLRDGLVTAIEIAYYVD
jgi:hypothetical protein